MTPTPATLQQSRLQSFSDLEYILLGDLRDILSEPIDRQATRWLLAILDALTDTLPRRFELEQEGGYLSEVLEAYPMWSPQVEQLRREHDTLFAKLRRLRNQIQRQVEFSRVAEEVQTELRDGILALTAHTRHERALVQNASLLEIGYGD